MKEFYQKRDKKNIKAFKNDIRMFSKQKGLTFQETEDSEIEWMCQMKKDNKLTLGVASKAVTVIIEEFSDDTIKIRVGEGKWDSKIAGAIVSTVVTGGLFLIVAPVTVMGIVRQARLIKEIRNLIRIHFN